MNDAALDIIAQAIADPSEYSVSDVPYVAKAVVLDLDRAGYVIRKKPAPRKATTPAEPFAPNTGDPALDAFMRAHHDPNYKPLPLPRVLDHQRDPLGKHSLAYSDSSQNRKRGGDKRALAVVLAEAEADAKKYGWPGRYDILGTKITN